MIQGLIDLTHFGLFTFTTTSQALKAEKILQAEQADFIVIPTLREISASCGLSVKFRQEDGPVYYKYLEESRVQVEGIYLVDKTQGSYQLTKKQAL